MAPAKNKKNREEIVYAEISFVIWGFLLLNYSWLVTYKVFWIGSLTDSIIFKNLAWPCLVSNSTNAKDVDMLDRNSEF